MSAVVFRGPSIAADEASRLLDATYLPPAAQGDIYRVAASGPEAIGLIDGRFQDLPAVWHKEILWALDRGIPVYGAASMGALRAAETSAFGMRGVGRVYEAYAGGVLEDDDEVAVAHLGADGDYRAVSDAMVDIRATMAAARSAGVIDAEEEAALVATAKQMYFPDRNYDALLRLAGACGLSPTTLAACVDWLPDNAVHQKHADACEMLRVMAAEAGEHVPGRSFRFEHTQFFERARRSVPPSPTPTAAGLPLDGLIDELKVHTELYLDTRRGALMRHLAVREARRSGWDDLDASDVDTELERFSRRRQLGDATAVAAYLRANDMSVSQFRGLLREEVLVGRVWQTMRAELDVYLRNQLRIDGHYPRLARLATDKQTCLEEAELDPADPAEASDDEVLAWFFGGTDPEERWVIADEYAATVDVSSRAELIRLLRGEYLLRRMTREHGPDSVMHRETDRTTSS